MIDKRVDLGIGWDDLRSPATVLKVGSTAPSTNTTYGWLEFAHNQNQYVFTHVQLPHSWRQGTALQPHVHWMKTTSATGEVEWQFLYRWVKIGEVMDASWLPATGSSVLTPAVSDGNTAYQHALSAFGEIPVDGVQISDMLVCKITRLGSSYSGANHYTAPAALLEFDIHYQIDSFGSNYEYLKARR